MKRTIKFRGLRKDGKGWVYGVPFEIKEEGICFMIDNCQSSFLTQEDTSFQGKEVIPETVGQYTGLKDKNGVAIYEGDIIGWSYYCQEDLIKESSVVKWISETLSFDIGDYNKPDFCPLEIIGNIHEKGGEK